MQNSDKLRLSWSGEYRDRQHEEALRRFNWEHDFRRAQITAFIGAPAFLIYTLLDLHHLGPGPGYFILLGGRLITAAALIGAALYFSAHRYDPALFHTIFGGQLLLSTTFFLAELWGADAVSTSYAHALLIVLVYYLVVPNRLAFTAIAAGFTSITFLLAAWLRGDPTDLLLTGVLMLAAGNALGIHQRRMSNIDLRQRFATIQAQASLNKKLMAAEGEAQESARLFRDVFEATPFPLLLTRERDYCLLHANKAAADFFKIPFGKVGHMHTSDFLQNRKDARQVLEQVHGAGRKGPIDLEVVTYDGERRWIETLSLPFDFRGEPAFITGTADITERRRYEEILQRARQEAEAASRAKSEFLANVSHELRTPLNAILGFSSLLKERKAADIKPQTYAEYVSYIHNSGEHLLQLINDLLDLSKIEAGKYELREEEHDLRNIVGDVCRMMSERATAASLDLQIQLPKRPLIVLADARCIRQFLLNTISNAIKFTPAGGSVTVAAEFDEKHRAYLSVTDTGIGIAEADMARALAPFSQVDGALARKHEGTGLGLPLAKKMAELHDGEFHISSRLGEGTQVSMILPADRTCTSHSKAVSA